MKKMLWYEKIKIQVNEREPQQVKFFTQRIGIDTQNSRNEVVLQWTWNVKNMIRKVEKLPREDIKRYFEC